MSEKMLEEHKTIAQMAAIYCQAKHGTREGLCESCQDLMAYADLRLAACPFAPDKPVCAKCPVHCYQPEKRERIREVMRFAGPRMLFFDPVAAIKHMVALRRKPSPAVERAIVRKAAQSELSRGNDAQI
jgi:hypothetical protein